MLLKKANFEWSAVLVCTDNKYVVYNCYNCVGVKEKRIPRCIIKCWHYSWRIDDGNANLSSNSSPQYTQLTYKLQLFELITVIMIREKAAFTAYAVWWIDKWIFILMCGEVTDLRSILFRFFFRYDWLTIHKYLPFVKMKMILIVRFFYIFRYTQYTIHISFRWPNLRTYLLECNVQPTHSSIVKWSILCSIRINMKNRKKIEKWKCWKELKGWIIEWKNYKMGILFITILHRPINNSFLFIKKSGWN